MTWEKENNKQVTDKMEAGKAFVEIVYECPDRYCQWLEKLNREDLRYLDH